MFIFDQKMNSKETLENNSMDRRAYHKMYRKMNSKCNFSIKALYLALLLLLPCAMWSQTTSAGGANINENLVLNWPVEFTIEPGVTDYLTPHIFIQLRTFDLEIAQTTLVSYDYSLEVEITPYLEDGTPDATYTKTLQLSYKTYGGTAPYADLAYHKIPNAFGAEVKVLNYSLENVEGGSLSETPDNLGISIGFRGDNITPLANNIPSIEAKVIYQDWKIEFDWNKVQGAEFYQLEWTWVDNYYADQDGKIDYTERRSAEDIKFDSNDFRNNSTRVELSGVRNAYRIPHTYDRGFLMYRIRAVGRSSQDLSLIHI